MRSKLGLPRAAPIPRVHADRLKLGFLRAALHRLSRVLADQVIVLGTTRASDFVMKKGVGKFAIIRERLTLRRFDDAVLTIRRWTSA